LLGELSPYSCEKQLNYCEVRKVDNDDVHDVVIQFMFINVPSQQPVGQL